MTTVVTDVGALAAAGSFLLDDEKEKEKQKKKKEMLVAGLSIAAVGSML